MTMNRPRLAAIALVALLALALGFLVFSFDARDVETYRVASPEQLLVVPAEPPIPSMMTRGAAAPTRYEAPADDAGPNVSPTAAPGVAFNYRYAFRLAPARIAAVQEQHAQRCERLGLARCRITGMLYRVVDARHAEARLELKLDPAIARQFGRTAADAVVRAQGMLAESEISGVDAAGAIRAAGRDLTELNAELERIEARLRAGNARSTERPRLEDQAQQLRAQIRALRDSREAQQDSLATTPMMFQYASGEPAPAPAAAAERMTLSIALDRAMANFLGAMNILLIILVTVLPWAVAALLVGVLVRSIRRRWFAAPAAAPAATA